MKKSLKKVCAMTLTLLLCGSLAGCGSVSADQKDTAKTNGSVKESSLSAKNSPSADLDPDGSANPENSGPSSDSHYPVTLTTYDYEGNEIETTYEKAPQRVLCVYQGTIETMIALGLEDRVTACYGLDNPVKEEWEDGLAKMHYQEDVFAPDKETVLLMEPDLIFSWGSIFSDKNLGSPAEWIANGTNTYISTNTRPGGHPRTLENEYTDLLNIGKIFDVEDQAQALVDDMKQEIASVLDQTKGQDAPRVCVIEFLDDTISNYGASQLGGDMVAQLGGKLAEPDASTIGEEDLLRLDPDVIFIVYMARTENVEAQMRAKIMDNPAFADLSAVKNRRVCTIMLGDLYASTVRSIDGIRTFAAGMYPQLSK